MSAGSRVPPRKSSWVAAIYKTQDDNSPLGTGIVLDDWRILTCAHVVRDAGKCWAAFPHADVPFAARRQLQETIPLNADAQREDLAILRLASPIPAGVTHAPLRSPESGDLTGKRWWAFGFPENEGPDGNSADGTIGTHLGNGRILLHTSSNYRVHVGFSGAGIWCPDFNAVVAVVCKENEDKGDGKAITLHHAVQCFPDQELRVLAERQVVVGARQASPSADPLAESGGSAQVLDVHQPEFSSREDRVAYTGPTVQQAGRALFLRASPEATTGGLREEVAADPAKMTVPPVDDAVRERFTALIRGLADFSAGVSAQQMLTTLAFAETPGFSASLWVRAVRALGFGDVTESALRRLADSPAASFAAISAASEASAIQFRIRNQELSAFLLQARAGFAKRGADEGALAQAFTAAGQRMGWAHAPRYLLHSLPVHSARAGLMDELLADQDYLLYADLSRLRSLVDLNRLRSLADRETKALALERARLLRLSPPGVINQDDAASRVAMFSVTEAVEGLGESYLQSDVAAPYRAAWALVPPSAEHSILHGQSDAVNDLCAFTAPDGTVLLATADNDAKVRVWDPAKATLERIIPGSGERIRSVRAFTPRGGDTQLVFSSEDGTISIWNAVTKADPNNLTGYDNWHRGLCSLTLKDGTVLAIAAKDHSVRLWDPDTGVTRRTLTGHMGSVSAICAFEFDEMPRLATASLDDSVRIWNPVTGQTLHMLTGHKGPVNAVCAFELHGVPHIASASQDGTVRIWDAATGSRVRIFTRHDSSVNAVCAVPLKEGTVLASADRNGTVRTWDPRTGTDIRTLTGHTGSVNAICTLFREAEDPLLVSAGADRIIRIWDRVGEVQSGPSTGETPVSALCAFTAADVPRLAVAGQDRVIRIRDPATGVEVNALPGHGGPVNAVCTFTLDGGTRVAVASQDSAVHVWDLATRRVSTLTGHASPVNAVCAFTLVDGSARLATGGGDGTVRTWNPATAARDRTYGGRGSAAVNAVCAFTPKDITLLAVGDDQTLRILNAANVNELRSLTCREGVRAITAFTRGGVTLLATVGYSPVVRIWNPATGSTEHSLIGHDDWVSAITSFTFGGTELQLLATTGSDATVRVWNPAKPTSPLVIPIRDKGLSMTYVDGLLAVGTSTGVLAIRLDPEFLSRSLL
jgi:WD40 repeat protein